MNPAIADHPDGRIGRFSLQGSFSYASVSADTETALKDQQQYVVELRLVPHRRFSVSAGFRARQQDSTVYELSGDLRVYSKDPLSAAAVNADGPVGNPVLHLTGGVRYSTSRDAAVNGLTRAAVILPLSPFLTLSGGYHFYEVVEPSDIRRAFGTATIYPRRYMTGMQYVNPDGPPGYVAVRISGGGSSRGYFGNVELILPLQPVTTLKLQVGAERNDLLSRRSFEIGIGVAVYPLPG